MFRLIRQSSSVTGKASSFTNQDTVKRSCNMINFLLCHAYGAFRRDLLSSVNAILLPHGMMRLSKEELLKIILYGHEQLSLDSNSKILMENCKVTLPIQFQTF